MRTRYQVSIERNLVNKGFNCIILNQKHATGAAVINGPFKKTARYIRAWYFWKSVTCYGQWPACLSAISSRHLSDFIASPGGGMCVSIFYHQNYWYYTMFIIFRHVHIIHSGLTSKHCRWNVKQKWPNTLQPGVPDSIYTCIVRNKANLRNSIAATSLVT